MSDEVCGEPHPDRPGVTCAKPPHPFGVHQAFPAILWPGIPIPARPEPGSRGKEVRRIITAIQADPKNTPPVGPPKTGIRTAHPMTQAEGMKAAHGAASPEFKAEARATIERLARARPTLTTDDVWLDLRARDWDTPHRACMGTLIQNAVRVGWIVKTTEMMPTEREDQRAHGLIVWRSLIFEGHTPIAAGVNPRTKDWQ